MRIKGSVFEKERFPFESQFNFRKYVINSNKHEIQDEKVRALKIINKQIESVKNFRQ